MLGDGGLLHFHGVDDLADRAFLERQVVENIAAPRFGYGVECVGGGGSSRHAANICPYRNMSSVIFVFRIPRAGAYSTEVLRYTRGGKFMTTRLLARASFLFVLLFALCGAAFANNSWIGTLLDAGGKPVTGAAVHLHSNSHDYGSRTDGGGGFYFESVGGGGERRSG